MRERKEIVIAPLKLPRDFPEFLNSVGEFSAHHPERNVGYRAQILRHGWRADLVRIEDNLCGAVGTDLEINTTTKATIPPNLCLEGLEHNIF
jgi:hypothetical protein